MHLKDKKIVVFLAKLFEEVEFLYPCIRLKEAGATVIVAGEEAEKIVKGKHGFPSVTEKAYGDIKADAIDGVVIPGGFGPDFMRDNKDCLDLVTKVHEQGKMIAFICHAGWVPISCGILKGKRATSVCNIRDDMVNAGCKWEDTAFVQDGNLLSSRTPDDLPDFMQGIISYLGNGK